MYFDSASNNWYNSGNADFSYSTTTYTSLALDAMGNQYMLATESDPYAWKHACLVAPIMMQPTDQSVCANSLVSLVVKTDNSVSGFQWQYNFGFGWQDLADTSIYSGTNTDSMVISSAKSYISGMEYRCILTNFCGNDTTQGAVIYITSGAPTISVTSSTGDSICAHSTVMLMATGTLTGNTPKYLWKKNGANVATGTMYMDSTLRTGDSIKCVLTSSATCATPDSATSKSITYFVRPDDTAHVSIVASADSICNGASVTYTATAVNKAGGIVSYQWYYNGAAVAGQTASTYTHTYGGGGGGGGTFYPTYCVITISGNTTCLYSQSATSNSITPVRVTSITPSVAISTPKDTICKGNTVTFSSTFKNGGTFNTYQWNLNGTAITGAAAATYSLNTLNNGDSISLTFTPRNFGGGCTFNPTNVTSKTIKMTVNPIITPTLTFIPPHNGYLLKAGQSDTFIASTYCTGGGGAYYQWYVNGSAVTGATSSMYVTNALNSGTDLIKVTVTCKAPCGGSTSDSAVFTVTGINEIAGIASHIAIFPNPNNGQFNVKADIANGKYNTCQVEVINALGQLVSTQTETIGGGHLDALVNMNSAAAGLYLVRVVANQEVLFTGRISVK
jgi:hypothetical protein